MQTFKQFIQANQLTTEEKLICMLCLAEESDMLNESVELIESRLAKFGLHAVRSKGLIDYVKSIGTGAGGMLLAAIKGDKDKIKQIASGIEKSDVVDFFLKLDQATLHLVTGPLHMIDAITGWHIGADIHKHVEKAKSVIADVKDSIINVKDKLDVIIKNSKKRQRVFSHIKKLETDIPV
jgi:hypothetical protein